METGKRIRTPWKHRWRRFRYGALPVVFFLIALGSTLWLWERQGRMPNAVGEVEVVRLDVAAGTAGRLVPLPELPQGHWTLFDPVRKRQVIARLDNRPVHAALETLRRELVRLRLEVDAAAAQTAIDQTARQQDHVREVTRLTWQIERLRLDEVDRQALIEADRVELRRLQARLKYLEGVRERRAVTEMEVVDQQHLRDQLARRVAENSAALEEAHRQRETAEERLRQFPPLRLPEIEKLLAPIQAATATQEARIDELKLQIEGLEIHAPITGTISGIHRWPGQDIQPGDPIITLAAQSGRYIVSYVRQQQQFRPAVGMPVDVRLQLPGARHVAAAVERVGPQMEPIPPHLLRDPNILEWGLPVRIVLPNELQVRPGELVDLTFQFWRRAKAG